MIVWRIVSSFHALHVSLTISLASEFGALDRASRDYFANRYTDSQWSMVQRELKRHTRILRQV